MNWYTPIRELTRVGKTTASRLKRIGLETVEDLIFYFPFRHEDYSLLKKIKDLVPNEPVTVRAKIQLIAGRRGFRSRKFLTEAIVGDDTDTLKAVWFNQPYLSKILKVGDEIYLSGVLDETRFQMVSPEYERVKPTPTHTGRLVPIYHLTEGVTQKQIRFLLSQTVPLMALARDYLPAGLIAKYRFLDLNNALQNIHFPANKPMEAEARRRLKFDELFLIQLSIQKMRQELGALKSPRIKFLEKQTRDFVAGLPYKLTNAQKKCAWEILGDLDKDKPMNRLLEGDVGSGKTVVVAIAVLNAVLNGYKVVIMAPTEILATQHFQTLCGLFEKQEFKIALFTAGKMSVVGDDPASHERRGNPPPTPSLVRRGRRTRMLEMLRAGDCDVVVGTHALIENGVAIKDLGLVVVDEQHRFGVSQRQALNEKGRSDRTPHFLSLTATPIPRTLVLALYGDLDLSVISEMPAGRLAVITRVVYEQDRLKSYEFIKKQVTDGRQVFVICPLIDPSDKLGVKSAKQEYERLAKNVFPDLRIGLMHGRLKSKEKESVMADFKQNKLDILVSTSVIEVGIDIPNATIMMIEGAERFGLAQLHQFRGRVGRGKHQSYCFLFSTNNSPLTRKRLSYMEICRDGFKLAEKDLELRGPGEVYGVKQSGLPDLKIASLTDVELIKTAQMEARKIVEAGELNNELKLKLEKMNLSMHFE